MEDPVVEKLTKEVAELKAQLQAVQKEVADLKARLLSPQRPQPLRGASQLIVGQ